MKIFLTGKPGVGKTTAIANLLRLLNQKAVGFYTQEIREEGKRVGFKLVTTWGEEFVFAHISFDGPRVSKYGVNLEVLESVISRINALSSNRLVVIDEIGKMETLSGNFVRWVNRILSSPSPVIGTIPIRSKHPLVEKIRRKYPVWEVTPVNRDAMPFRILDAINKEALI